MPLRTASAVVWTAACGTTNQPRGPADQILADRASAGTFGDDCAQTGIARRRLQHHLATDREANPPDATIVHVRLLSQPGDCSIDVLCLHPSRTRSSHRRCRRSRARRGAGRRSRAARASAPEAASPSGSGTRSRRPHSARARTTPRDPARRSSSRSRLRTALPRSPARRRRAVDVSRGSPLPPATRSRTPRARSEENPARRR